MKFSKIIILSSMFLLSTTYPTFSIPFTTQQSPDCAICSTSEPILYEDSLIIVVKNQLSTLKTCLLIIPKKHIANLDALDLDDRSNQQLLIHLMSVAQMLASRLTGTQNYRITINSGSELQDIPHLCLQFESNDTLQKS